MSKHRYLVPNGFHFALVDSLKEAKQIVYNNRDEYGVWFEKVEAETMQTISRYRRVWNKRGRLKWVS